MLESVPRSRPSTGRECCSISPSTFNKIYQPLKQPRKLTSTLPLSALLAWSGVSDLNIQQSFNKVGFSQLHIDPPSENTPDPDFESDVTTEMRQLTDVAFREFINVESDKIIHSVVAEPGTLQADADVVPDDYQRDEVLDPTPQHKTTIAEDTTNLA